MCIAPSYGPKGQESIAQGLYLFCVASYGPKGQDNLAQGLPWVSQKNVFSPEGASGRECHSHDRKAILAAWYSPFRANPVGNLTQGKPWAKLSWPFGPQRTPGARHPRLNAPKGHQIGRPHNTHEKRINQHRSQSLNAVFLHLSLVPKGRANEPG
jgi:hypothetical protein